MGSSPSTEQSEEKAELIESIMEMCYRPLDSRLDLRPRQQDINKGIVSVRELLKSRNLRGLSRMDLSHCKMAMSDMKSLSNKKWLNLAILAISNAFEGSEMLEKLLENEWPALRQLYLDRNKLGTEGIEILLKNKQILFVERLCLQNNNIGGIGLRRMPQIQKNALKQLFLRCNPIGSRGAKYLAKASLPNLSRLFLGNGQLGREGLRALAKGKWPLTQLGVATNDKGMDGYMVIAGCSPRSLNSVRICEYNQYAHPITLLNLVVSTCTQFDGQMPEAFKNQLEDIFYTK